MINLTSDYHPNKGEIEGSFALRPTHVKQCGE